MHTIEKLKQELSLVVQQARIIKGIHTEVNNRCGISEIWSIKIRNNDEPKGDTEENRETIKKMINAYRQVVREKINELKKIV